MAVSSGKSQFSIREVLRVSMLDLDAIASFWSEDREQRSHRWEHEVDTSPQS